MALPVMLTPALEIGFVDKRRSPRAGITDAVSFVDYTDFASPAALDTALAAAVPTVYTAAYLAKLNVNDKIYALRVIQEGASL